MDTAQSITLVGIGFIIGGVLMAIAVLLHLLPDDNRAKRLWAVIIPSIIIGIALVVF